MLRILPQTSASCNTRHRKTFHNFSAQTYTICTSYVASDILPQTRSPPLCPDWPKFFNFVYMAIFVLLFLEKYGMLTAVIRCGRWSGAMSGTCLSPSPLHRIHLPSFRQASRFILLVCFFSALPSAVLVLEPLGPSVRYISINESLYMRYRAWCLSWSHWAPRFDTPL